MVVAVAGEVLIPPTSHNDLNNNPDNTHGHKNSAPCGGGASVCARLAGIMRSRKTWRNSVNMLEVNEVPRG